jgi:5-methylthioadenosine/S-adenosylhomocysteine deaminase
MERSSTRIEKEKAGSLSYFGKETFMGSIIIKNGVVLTMDKKRAVIPDGVVEIEKDRITYVGSDFGKATSGISTTMIDAKGKVVMPGLINGHTHLCMTFARTVCFEVNLMDWINKIQYPLMDEMGEEDYYLAAMVGCINNLKNGTTTIEDFICSSHKGGVDADRPTARAVKEIGVRSVLARSYADQNYYENAIEKKEMIAARCREFVQEFHNTENGRLKVRIGPVVPWACSGEMFQETVRLSEKLGIGLHMHANEGPNWDVLVEKFHGVPRNIGLYRKYSCLGPGTTIAAMRVISDQDIMDLAETGTGLILDPAAALNRGTGLPPIPKVLAAGIRVGLGTNTVGEDMFENIKAAGWIARTVDGSPEALPLNVALEMATIRNAEILGIGDQVGSLEVGKKADVIVVNLNKFHYSPCLNVLSGVGLFGPGRDVEEVIIDGRLIVKQGRVVDLDEDAIIQDANARALFCAKKAHLENRLSPLYSAKLNG